MQHSKHDEGLGSKHSSMSFQRPQFPQAMSTTWEHFSSTCYFELRPHKTSSTSKGIQTWLAFRWINCTTWETEAQRLVRKRNLPFTGGRTEAQSAIAEQPLTHLILETSVSETGEEGIFDEILRYCTPGSALTGAACIDLTRKHAQRACEQ